LLDLLRVLWLFWIDGCRDLDEVEHLKASWLPCGGRWPEAHTVRAKKPRRNGEHQDGQDVDREGQSEGDGYDSA
jgi:hypothetical protein